MAKHRSDVKGTRRGPRYQLLRWALAILAIGLAVVVNWKFAMDASSSAAKWFILFDGFDLMFIANLTSAGRKATRALASSMVGLLPWSHTNRGNHSKAEDRTRSEIEKANWNKDKQSADPRD